MHYSPFPVGFGLLAIGSMPLGGSPLEIAARLLLDLAGGGFLLLAFFFVCTNLYGSLSRGGRHRASSALVAGRSSTRGREGVQAAR